MKALWQSKNFLEITIYTCFIKRTEYDLQKYRTKQTDKEKKHAGD
jgi:hypothetical protein